MTEPDTTNSATTKMTYLEELKSLPRPAWFLFLGAFLNRFGTFVFPFLALYMTRTGYTMSQAGIAMASYAAGHLAAALLAGYLADRFGRRRTIALSMFTSALFMLLLSQAWNFPTFIIFAFFTGAATRIYRPASGALLADLVPEERRIAAFSMYRFAINLGWAFGPATAGFVAQYSYFWLFVGDAFTAILFGLIALVALPHGVRSPKEESGWGPALRSMAGNRVYLVYLAASGMVAMLYFQWTSTFSIHVKTLGYSAVVYGWIQSLNGLLIVVFELPISAVVRHYHSRRIMALGFAVIGIGFGMIIFANGVWMLAAAMAVFTLGEMISAPSQIAFATAQAPRTMRGRYMAGNGMMWSTAAIISPLVGMNLYPVHPDWLWLGGAALGLLGAATILAPVTRKATVPEAPAPLLVAGRGDRPGRPRTP